MMEGGYQNGHVPLEAVVAAFTDHTGTPTDRLSAEQLHDLADLISTARHDRHGQPTGQTRETVVIAQRDGPEVYREEVTTSTLQGEK